MVPILFWHALDNLEQEKHKLLRRKCFLPRRNHPQNEILHRLLGLYFSRLPGFISWCHYVQLDGSHILMIRVSTLLSSPFLLWGPWSPLLYSFVLHLGDGCIFWVLPQLLLSIGLLYYKAFNQYKLPFQKKFEWFWTLRLHEPWQIIEWKWKLSWSKIVLGKLRLSSCLLFLWVVNSSMEFAKSNLIVKAKWSS